MNPISNWSSLPTWAKIASLPLLVAGIAVIARVILITVFSIVILVGSTAERARRFITRKSKLKIIDADRTA